MRSSEAIPALSTSAHLLQAQGIDCILSVSEEEKEILQLREREASAYQARAMLLWSLQRALSSDCLDKLKYSSLVCQTLEEDEKTKEDASFLLPPKHWRGLFVSKRYKKQ